MSELLQILTKFSSLSALQNCCSWFWGRKFCPHHTWLHLIYVGLAFGHVGVSAVQCLKARLEVILSIIGVAERKGIHGLTLVLTFEEQLHPLLLCI